MQVKIIKEDSNSLEIDVTGADQSLLQIIQEELLKDKRVSFAAYNKPHPLLKSQTMRIAVKEGNPKVVFGEGCEKAVEKTKKAITLLGKVMERA
jgi:DNA-directed RNA polymerase subunit L